MYICNQCHKQTSYLLEDGSCNRCFDFEAYSKRPVKCRNKKANKDKSALRRRIRNHKNRMGKA